MSLSADIKGPFDVKTEDLMQINERQAVDLFRELLVIEAMKVGIPVTGVDAPTAINVSDGGVDAQVSGASAATLVAGLIAEGLTCYQIKTGDFSASTPSDVRSLLVQPKFMKSKPAWTKEELQPRVLHCFENGGTFAVVLFGTDLVNPDEDHGKRQISEFMAAIDPAFANVPVRIVRATQLCSAIKMLAPGLALRLNRAQGQDDAIFQSIEFMSESCALEVDGYHSTPELDAAAAEITSAADSVNGFQHVRVLGDAGAGKTHLMYRALSTTQLRSCVLYCSDPERAQQSAALMALRDMSRNTTIILVADECDLETAEELTALFRKLASKMLLVTAHNVAESTTDHAKIKVIEVPQLQPGTMSEIFAGYGIPSEDAEWLATLCAGSPRAAHALGQYIQHNPEQHRADQFAHLDRLWDRMVCQPHSVESRDGGERLAVIRTLALFRQVAWETNDGPDVQKAILSFMRELDQNFSTMRLAECVKELRRRRILQGPRTLLISPKLLHVAMWKSWFENYHSMVNVLNLRAGLSDRMQEHFDAMLKYAIESKAATLWVERLLAENGIFATLASYKDSSNASLFFAVAQASPKVALRRFAAALGKAPVQERMQFKGEARRLSIERLEQLAVPAETFFDAAQCLLLLAEAENESWSNNATGVFISLFGLGSGELAASELAPVEKVSYLESVLRGSNKRQRELVVQALGKSLDPFMSRVVTEDVIGLRRLPNRWRPSKFEDMYTAYSAHVQLLVRAFHKLPEQEGIEAAKALLDNVRSLVLVAPLNTQIIAFLHDASRVPTLAEKCIETIETTLHYESGSLSDSVNAELKTLRNALTHSNFEQKLRRYAGMKLLEDNFDSGGEYQEGQRPELLELVEESLNKPDFLNAGLSWLVTGEAKNGFQFGQLLGKRDDNKLWGRIFNAWQKAGDGRSDFFVGGYLSAVHGKNRDMWESTVMDMLRSDVNARDTLHVIWRSGMSERVAKTLIKLAACGQLDPSDFRLFVYGGVTRQIPYSELTGMIDLLVERASPTAADAALEILDSRLRGNREEFPRLANRIEHVLNLADFIGGCTSRTPNNMTLFYWNEMALLLLERNPDAGGRLAVRCISHFASENSVTAGYRPEPLKFLSAAANVRPDVVWGAIAHRLENPKRDVGTWHMLQWIRGERQYRQGTGWPLAGVPMPLMFKWIDEDAENRAWLLAEHCEPTISKPGEPTSFARAILERYGDLETVRTGLHANHVSGTWSGPASEHFGYLLDQVKGQIAVETNEHVRRWLGEEKERLSRTVERAKEREEREDDF